MAYQCKLIKNVSRVVQRTSVIKSVGILSRGKCKDNRVLQSLTASTQAQTETEDDRPIKYTASKAAEWKARYTCYGENVDEVPKAQQYAILLSFIAFLVYFCILREENDLDDFMRAAETKVPEQLKKAVRNAAAHPQAHNRPEIAIYQRRLREMEEKEGKLYSPKFS